MDKGGLIYIPSYWNRSSSRSNICINDKEEYWPSCTFRWSKKRSQTKTWHNIVPPLTISPDKKTSKVVRLVMTETLAAPPLFEKNKLI